jgi:hypothetical protein
MDERTRALLEELAGGIDELLDGDVDRSELQRVANVAGAVERRLRAELELTDDDDTLTEDLQEAAVQLEVNHPALAAALRRAVDVFGALGL